MTKRTILILNKIIAALSLSIGLFLCYQSAELYYGYEYTSKLFLYMVPFNDLVIVFSLGLTAIIAGSLLLKSKPLSLVFFYSLGAGLLSTFFMALVNDDSAFSVDIERIFSITSATFILLYFNFSKVLETLDKRSRQKELVIGLIAGLTITVIPTLLLKNYYYS